MPAVLGYEIFQVNRHAKIRQNRQVLLRCLLAEILNRRSIPQHGPFRYIRKTDISQPFDNRLKSLNKLELIDFIKHNVANRHVFVYEFDGKILCILIFGNFGSFSNS